MKKNKNGTRKPKLVDNKYIGYLLKNQIPKNCCDCEKKAKIFVITKTEGNELGITGLCSKHAKETWNSDFNDCLDCELYGKCGFQKIVFKKEMKELEKIGLEIGQED